MSKLAIFNNGVLNMLLREPVLQVSHLIFVGFIVLSIAAGPESRARQVPEARARADGARERAR